MNEAWIAGFFDGDGHVGIWWPNNNPPQIQIMMSQAPPRDWVLDKIQSFLGYGRVQLKAGDRHGSQLWIIGHEDLTKFILAIGPKTILKKDQLSAALAILGMYNFGRVKTPTKALAYRERLAHFITQDKRSK